VARSEIQVKVCGHAQIFHAIRMLQRGNVDAATRLIAHFPELDPQSTSMALQTLDSTGFPEDPAIQKQVARLRRKLLALNKAAKLPAKHT
jgi:hypothetical protein